MRVNELSRELGRTNKEVLELLRKQGYEVKSHSSNVSDEQIAAAEEEDYGCVPSAEQYDEEQQAVRRTEGPFRTGRGWPVRPPGP